MQQRVEAAGQSFSGLRVDLGDKAAVSDLARHVATGIVQSMFL